MGFRRSRTAGAAVTCATTTRRSSASRLAEGGGDAGRPSRSRLEGARSSAARRSTPRCFRLGGLVRARGGRRRTCVEVARSRSASARSLPGAAPPPPPVVPPLASAVRDPDQAARPGRPRADVRRRPAPTGHAGGARAARACAGIRATFYLVGEQVERRPSLAAEIVAAGHEVGIHGLPAHAAPPPPPRDPSATTLEPRSGGDRRGEWGPRAVLTGRPTASSASPGSSWRATGGRRFCGRAGAVTGSGERLPTRSPRSRTRNLGPRDVILLHDADFYSVEGSWRKTVAALPAVLDQALASGEPLVTASQST